MIKFALRCNDKICMIEGAVPRILGHWVRKGYARKSDGSLQPFPDTYWWGAASEAGAPGDGEPVYMTTQMGNARLSTPPGSYLNAKSLCHLGRYLYSVHTVQNSWGAGVTEEFWYPRNPKMFEWDGVEDNVDNTVWPSGQGARIVFGYSSRASDRYSLTEGALVTTSDPALLSYNGHVVGVALYRGEGVQEALLDDTGDEAGRIDNYNASIDAPCYYTFWYDPKANNGSGFTTWNFHAEVGAGEDDAAPVNVTTPSWMLNLTQFQSQDYYTLFDSPYLNYNMTDAIEYQNRIYACNACHLVSFTSGAMDFNILYDTSSGPYTVSPKWLEKHDGNLYMLEASGTVSQITPSGDGIVKTTLADLSYVSPGNVRYGGIHAREWGIERATKDLIQSYQDKLHVFIGMGSGAYHFSSSGDMGTWTNHTADLPDILRGTQCNIYAVEDYHDNNLYVLACPMVADHGALGVITFGERVSGIGHLFSYNGTAWTQHAWFPIPSFWGAGGFIGFDYYGPHVEMPSGTAYPYGAASGDIVGDMTPILYKCKDYAIIDYKLIDELSRNIDVSIQYSIDDGCTWYDCRRFKDYQTVQYLGEGLTALSSSPSGEWHSFTWDFVNAVGYNISIPYTKLRVIPSISATQ